MSLIEGFWFGVGLSAGVTVSAFVLALAWWLINPKKHEEQPCPPSQPRSWVG